MQKTFNFFYAFLLAILGFGVTLMAEDITLTTYYPAPYGTYDELTTTGATSLATTSGNVGIGTTTTSRKLHITGDAYTTIRLDGTSGGQILLGTGSTEKWSMYVSSDVLGFYWFGVAPGDKVTINSSGNINAVAYSAGGTSGVDGSFRDLDGKTITVKKGIITSITP